MFDECVLVLGRCVYTRPDYVDMKSYPSYCRYSVCLTLYLDIFGRVFTKSPNTVNSRLADTPPITDTPIIRTVAKYKSPAKTNYNYRRLTETKSRYNRLSLLRVVTRFGLRTSILQEQKHYLYRLPKPRTEAIKRTFFYSSIKWSRTNHLL